MQIYYDYKIFYLQKYGGISNYFLKLYEEMIKLHKETYFVCPLYKNVYLKNKKYKKLNSLHLKYFPSNLNFFLEKYNRQISKRIINNIYQNIVHETYYSNSNDHQFFKGKKFCTVFDMINEKFPKHFKNSDKLSEIKKKTILRSDHIFCISETTKNDLIELFKVPEKKITTTLLASTLDSKTDYNQNKKFEDCLLFVGSRFGYKNFETFLKAFSISNKLKNNFRIICFGGEKISKREFELIENLNLREKILFFDDNNNDLAFLYQNVKCLVYPSLYEGFGLPILEAMSLGCPVISSDGGSLKEVGGDSCLYFNPSHIENIKDACEKFIDTDSLSKKLILKGYERSKLFSWNKCANLTLEKYNNF